MVGDRTIERAAHHTHLSHAQVLRLRPDYLFVKALRLAATLAPPPARPGSFWCHTQQQFTCIHTPDTCVRLRPQPCAAPCAADADGVPDVVVLCATCGLYSTAAGSAQPASAAGAPPRRALLQLLYDHSAGWQWAAAVGRTCTCDVKAG